MIGVDPEGLDDRIRELLPDYMTMGHSGMGEMGAMRMDVPKNSIPMVGGRGPFANIDMGGMFTVVKVREGLTSYENPGWYDHPEGTVATVASREDLRADGIEA